MNIIKENIYFLTDKRYKSIAKTVITVSENFDKFQREEIKRETLNYFNEVEIISQPTASYYAID